MRNLKSIRRRIKTVNNIAHLTDAMQKIAAFRLNKVRSRFAEGKKYIENIEKLMLEMLSRQPHYRHRLLNSNSSNSVLLFVIAGDKGLCGAYNSNIFREALKFKQNSKKDVKIIALGKKGVSFFKRIGFDILASWTDTPVFFEYSFCREIAEQIIGRYLKCEFSEIHCLYTQSISVSKNIPIITKLLPIDLSFKTTISYSENARKIIKDDIIYEPGVKEVLDYLISQWLNALIWKAMLESSVSECALRMISMEQATKNAYDMVDDLTLLGNKIRQMAITSELTDIVGSIEAMQQD
jgi:F-type H+-transporting ATPase subunit gamma